MSASIPRPVPAADVETGKRHLDEFGYAIHEKFLDSERVESLKLPLIEQAELELERGVGLYGFRGYGDARYRQAPPPGVRPPYQQVNFLGNKGREFVELAMHRLAHEYVRYALRNQPYAVATLTGLIVRKGAEQQVVHIDQQPLPFPTTMPTGLNIMFCLSDFDEDMGATRVVPGSHRGPPPAIAFDAASGRSYNPEMPQTVPAVATAGSAILFESRLWHGQGPSTSEKVRYSVTANYVMHFLKPQENYPASMHDDVYARLSDEEKVMFGFEATFSYGGRIAPRNPHDPRRNTNESHPYVPELRRTPVSD